MAPLIACCRDAIAVMRWLAAWISATNMAAVTPHQQVSPQVIWQVAGEGRGTPVIYGDAVFFLSRHHELLRLDIRTGEIIWRRPTHGPGATTAGTSLVVTSKVIVAGDDGLVAFSHEGVERWRLTSDQVDHAGAYLGESAGGVVFAGSSRGTLRAIDLESGSVRWSHHVAAKRRVTTFAPMATEGRVFAAFSALDDLRLGGVVAVDGMTGRELWRRSLAFAGGPVAVGALVLVAQQDGSIRAFDASSGASRWTLDPSGGTTASPDLRALTVSGRTLIAGSLTGLVTVYDLATRQERWRRAPMTASIAFGIAADDHTIYVPYLSGPLVALSIADGVERWRTSVDWFGFSWRPLVAAGRLLAASSDAGFFAFRL